MGGWIQQSDGKAFPIEAQYSSYLAERAIGKLDSAMQLASAESPIYLQLDFFDPHQPFSIPDGFQKREAELRRALTSAQQLRSHPGAQLGGFGARTENIRSLPQVLGPL